MQVVLISLNSVDFWLLFLIFAQKECAAIRETSRLSTINPCCANYHINLSERTKSNKPKCPPYRSAAAEARAQQLEATHLEVRLISLLTRAASLLLNNLNKH